MSEELAASASQIYQEAIRARDLQDGRLETLRGRATLVLGAATLAGGVFAVKDGVGVSLLFSSLAFSGLIACVVVVVWPRTWYETPNIGELVTNYIDVTDRPPADTLDRDLALIHYELWGRNEASLRRVKRWMAGAVACLGLFVLLLIINNRSVVDASNPSPTGASTSTTTHVP